MTDLEMALNKQKAENRKKNNRKKNADSEELTDIENTISAIITEMKNVAAVSLFSLKRIRLFLLL